MADLEPTDKWERMFNRACRVITVVAASVAAIYATKTNTQVIENRTDQGVRTERAEEERLEIKRKLLFMAWKQAENDYEWSDTSKNRAAMEKAKTAYDAFQQDCVRCIPTRTPEQQRG